MGTEFVDDLTRTTRSYERESRDASLALRAGKTPQIVTETLYALTQQHQQRVDEIRVITTLEGRNGILEHLLDPKHGKFFVFCRDYAIDPASINFSEAEIALLRTPDGEMLEDIRTVDDNEHAANQICQMVRDLTRDDSTAVHASVAGGRKTMGIYLTAAMQLFGRTQDQLSHVLVPEDFETHPDFYYIPPKPQELKIRDRQNGDERVLSTAQARIHLAPIPFIRLRQLLGGRLAEEDWRYSEEVKRAQEELEFLDAAHVVRLDAARRTVTVGQRGVQLPRRHFFFYALFAGFQQDRRGQEGFVSPSEITLGDLDVVYHKITRARGEELGLEQARQDEPNHQFVETLARCLRTGDLEALKDSIVEDVSRVRRIFRDQHLPARFCIETRGRYRNKLYGIAVPRERIEWE